MDGVLPNDFLAKPVLVASDGNIYMGGSEGLVRINKALKSASIPPPITLELQEVSLNGTIVPFNSQSTMEIPYNFSSLQIHTQLEGENVFHKRIYRFRIKGLNKGKHSASCVFFSPLYRSSSVVAAVLVHPNMCCHHYSFHYLCHTSPRPTSETKIQGTRTYHL